MAAESIHQLRSGPARVLLVLTALAVLAACQPRPGPPDPVVSAVRDNNEQRVGQYLAEGGDPNRVSNNGEPLLYVATGSRGGIEVMRRLLLGGANIEATNSSGRTALHNAAGWCHVQMVEELLAAGADTSATDNDGNTPLDTVCSGPLDLRAEVITLLGGTGE